jgi:type II secretion system protein N
MLLYIGYTLVLFVIFLLITFPHELLVRRALTALNRGAVEVDFKSLALTYRGYDIVGARVAPVADDQLPYFECSHLWVRPSLSALVRGNPYGLLMSAEVYGGQARAQVDVAGGGINGTLQWRDLDLSRYRPLTALLDEGKLGGKVSGQLTFEARRITPGAGQGTGELSIDGANITAAKVRGFTVPDVKLRQARSKFQVRPGHIELQEFQTTGDINAQGSGQITPRDPIEESVLNLRATLVTGLETPDAIKGLVALIPRPPGTKPDAPITITGTLAAPRVR